MKIIMTHRECVLTKTELTNAIYAKYEYLEAFAADLTNLLRGVEFDNLIDGYRVIVSLDSVARCYIRSVFNTVECGKREELFSYLIKADFTMFVECIPIVRTQVDLANYLTEMLNKDTFSVYVCSRRVMNLAGGRSTTQPDFCIKGKFWRIVQDNMSSTEIKYIRTLVSMSLSNKRSDAEVRALLHACKGVTIEKVGN